MKPLCSIIIRTHNEERWIGPCLRGVFSQTYKNFEVIIVDNESGDKTLEKAKEFPIKKVLYCRDYRPGKALNIGIREASGKYIVCLSSHCIPVNDKWLECLVRNMEEDEEVAGAYGRQEPMAFSSDADKRDLLLVFGLDRRVQRKDSFFHNANSIIRRSLWENVPFDEEITNIEDRLWAHKVLKMGYKIIYDPDARVYHYHGIHQSGNQERCSNVVKIIEGLSEEFRGGVIDAQSLNIFAIIPIKGPNKALAERTVLEYALNDAKESEYIKKIVVSADNNQVIAHAKSLGADITIERPEYLSKDYVGLEEVYKYTLEQLEEEGIYPDLLVTLEVTFPFRPSGIIDLMIAHALRLGLDSVIAAHAESRSIWRELEDGRFKRIDSGYAPREYKEKIFIGLKGLCCVTHPEFVREGKLLGNTIGLFKVDDPYSHLEVRSDAEFKMAEHLIRAWETEITI